MPAILDINTHPHPFVTVAELAAYCHFDQKTVRRHIDKGALVVHRIGPDHAIRIPLANAQEYCAATPTNGAGQS